VSETDDEKKPNSVGGKRGGRVILKKGMAESKRYDVGFGEAKFILSSLYKPSKNHCMCNWTKRGGH